MRTISIRLPDSVHRMAQKIAAMATQSYLGECAKRSSAQKFKAALAAVPDTFDAGSAEPQTR